MKSRGNALPRGFSRKSSKSEVDLMVAFDNVFKTSADFSDSSICREKESRMGNGGGCG